MNNLQSSGLIISIILSTSLVAQNTEQRVDCKVLKPEISGQYAGDCRNGLAHGSGTAVGRDTYEGKFKKGLPHGRGTYTFASGAVFTGRWKNGIRNGRGKLRITVEGRDSLVVGTWKDDEFVSAKAFDNKEASYDIIYSRSIERVRFLAMGRKNDISIKIVRSGLPIEVQRLMLNGSSGTQVASAYFIGFRSVEFPFRATAKYQVLNKMRTAVLDCEIEFIIYRPDGWEVMLQH